MTVEQTINLIKGRIERLKKQIVEKKMVKGDKCYNVGVMHGYMGVLTVLRMIDGEKENEN